ncbi:MAG: hypothetical protein HYR85_18460 [Planctomycetes bacterium]|nr:hypothetical protein [Planctomycetota bacterium]MBI3829445.1 hypothetical protein [Planctomycetota bacterium]
MPQGVEVADPNFSVPSQRPVAPWLFAGLLLCYLAVWKGDGGYLDLREYLDNAERIWLKGDLADPPAPGEAPTAPKRYSRFSLGLPFLSGPFVYVGALIERVSNGALGTRAITALAVPVFAALAGMLLYEIGQQTGCSASVSLWAALIFGLGSPLVSYARLYYAEMGLAFCLFLALWAHLRGCATAGRSGVAWTLLAGTGLAGAFACHYTSVLLVACVWLGLAGAILVDRSGSRRLQLARTAALAAAPCLTGAALLWLNYVHYGSPFRTGYDPYHGPEMDRLFVPSNLPGHLSLLLAWLVRVPWIVPVLVLWMLRSPSAHPGKGLALRLWRVGISLGFSLQLVFWLLFYYFPVFWMRYLMPLVALAAVGLPLLGETLARRWPRRGLTYAACALIAWNLLGVLHGDDGSRPVFAAADGSLQMYVWYMQPFEPGKAEGFGTPAGATQAAVFILLAAAGSAALVLALRRAHRAETRPPRT